MLGTNIAQTWEIQKQQGGSVSFIKDKQSWTLAEVEGQNFISSDYCNREASQLNSCSICTEVTGDGKGGMGD